MNRGQRILIVFGTVFLAAAGTLLLLTMLSKPARAGPLGQVGPTAGTTRYVATDGWDQTGSPPFVIVNDCDLAIWPPCRTVQHAVDQADPGDEILVATGVYTGVSARPAPAGYPNPPASGLVTQVVYISKTVTIQGGYTTANWNTPDPAANLTTLDAGGLGRVFVIAGNISPTIEGLRITGGNATGLQGAPWVYSAGGGVYVITATVTISNCVVNYNTANTGGAGGGGGLGFWHCDARLSNNTVHNNTASTVGTGRGGGLGSQGSTITLSGNTIADNFAGINDVGYGGGLFMDTGVATLNGNTVRGNTASILGAGAGGGLVLAGDPITLTGNVIVSNTASTDQEGRGGGVHLGYSDNATLSGNTIAGNEASVASNGYGGGVYLDHSAATLEGNTVQHNVASVILTGTGGGVYLLYSDARLTGNTVQSNTASLASTGAGGGVNLTWSGATLTANTVRGNVASAGSDGGGGGLYITGGGIPTLNGNTVQGNTASTAGNGYGGGLHLGCGAATLNGNVIVSNTATLNTTAQGGGGGLFVYSSRFTLTNNVVADNHANTKGSGMWFEGQAVLPAIGSLLHTTIANNRGSGQGVFVHENTVPDFVNTIVAGHASVGITVTAGSTVTLEGTLWHGNGAHTGGGGAISIGTVNVYEPPAFADPATWDYHLTAGSAAIDAGVDAGVTTDIDGGSRPHGSASDLGADEFGSAAAPGGDIYLPIILKSSP